MYRSLKDKARALRIQGKSMKEIERELGTARSNVSNWVRDIELTQTQLGLLKERQHSQSVVEKRRESRLRNESAIRLPWLLEGKGEVLQMGHVDLMMLALGIYLGEGSKTARGKIALANCDPRVIQIFVKFLIEVCHVPRTQLRGNVGLHSHLSVRRAEQYWSRVSGIPRRQFIKTVFQQSKASKGERDRLPFGTFTVYVNDTKKRIKLEGWMQGVYQRLFPEYREFHGLTKLKI